jgi:hypothetical protein
VTQITAEQSWPADLERTPALRRENVMLEAGRGVGLSGLMILLGAIGIAVTAGGGFFLHKAREALAAYLIGLAVVLGLSLGGLFFTMAFHLTQAGWAVSIRRQFENLASMVLPCFVLFLLFMAADLAGGGILSSWLVDRVAEPEAHLLHAKSAYLNLPFVVGRSLVYFAIWIFLARRLRGLSLEQDRTGDKWLSNKARFTCSWGMLAFALSVAFFSFDWLMALTDFRFFSTMWGVYYFAGCAFSSVPLIVIVLSTLLRAGKLQGAVTNEHFHDLGKLMFGFTVFWAYIAFSQYFLIWYSNIPEETAFYNARNIGVWHGLSLVLGLGHFVVPFYILLWKVIRRTPSLLALVAVYMIVLHVADIYWIVRPAVQFLAPGQVPTFADIGPGLWLDAAGILGVMLLWGGLLIRTIIRAPLVPLHDPRMPEALHHRNYV